MTAFMADADADKPNPIHSTGTARQYGFSAALIGGATAWGWVVRDVLAAQGPDWLEHGWVELQFRKPLYPGDAFRVRIAADGALSITRGDETAITARVGTGNAPWRGELAMPANWDIVPAAQPHPRLTLTTAPVGQDLGACGVRWSVADALRFAREELHETHPRLLSDPPPLHPGWLAMQPIHWLHHHYDYGPSIHAASRMQLLSTATAGSQVRVAGTCVDAYERRGHHYIVNSCALRADDALVAQLEHTAIFRIRERDET